MPGDCGCDRRSGETISDRLAWFRALPQPRVIGGEALREATVTRHFGVLIPSTNTTVEMECRLLPATYQAHVGRLMSSGGGSFSPSRDEDIDHQSRRSEKHTSELQSHSE